MFRGSENKGIISLILDKLNANMDEPVVNSFTVSFTIVYCGFIY